MCTNLDCPMGNWHIGVRTRVRTRETPGWGARGMGPDAIFAARTLPMLGCFVQMIGFLGGHLLKYQLQRDRGMRRMNVLD